MPDSPTSTAEFQRTLYELSVYQIELEMQNEQLQDSYDEIQKEKSRYAELYDFAPIGYLTLAEDSTILEANLTATRILSLDRLQLKRVCFGGLIAQQELPAFNSMMNRAHLSRVQEYSEVMIVSRGSEKPGSAEKTFRLDCIISENLKEYHLTLTDVTDTRVAVEELKRKEERFRSKGALSR
jgi:PAS domain-containing protein